LLEGADHGFGGKQWREAMTKSIAFLSEQLSQPQVPKQ